MLWLNWLIVRQPGDWLKLKTLCFYFSTFPQLNYKNIHLDWKHQRQEESYYQNNDWWSVSPGIIDTLNTVQLFRWLSLTDRIQGLLRHERSVGREHARCVGPAGWGWMWGHDAERRPPLSAAIGGRSIRVWPLPPMEEEEEELGVEPVLRLGGVHRRRATVRREGTNIWLQSTIAVLVLFLIISIFCSFKPIIWCFLPLVLKKGFVCLFVFCSLKLFHKQLWLVGQCSTNNTQYVH